MTSVCFLRSGGRLKGFEIKGHAMTAKAGRDILCAAVSSAAYLTVNTATEVLGVKAEAGVKDGYMKFELCGDYPEAENLLKGFKLHIKELMEQYPKNIELIYKEGAE